MLPTTITVAQVNGCGQGHRRRETGPIALGDAATGRFSWITRFSISKTAQMPENSNFYSSHQNFASHRTSRWGIVPFSLHIKYCTGQSSGYRSYLSDRPMYYNGKSLSFSSRIASDFLDESQSTIPSSVKSAIRMASWNFSRKESSAYTTRRHSFCINSFGLKQVGCVNSVSACFVFFVSKPELKPVGHCVADLRHEVWEFRSMLALKNRHQRFHCGPIAFHQGTTALPSEFNQKCTIAYFSSVISTSTLISFDRCCTQQKARCYQRGLGWFEVVSAF